MNFDLLLSPLRLIWARQSAREQALLASCAALIVVLLVWFAVLSPALSYRNAMRASFEAQVEDHLEIVAGVERYRALSAAEDVSAEAAAPLRTIVANRAREAGVTITRVQPMENGQLGVWADRAGEAQLMTFLLVLAEEDGVRATRLSLEREEAGLVRAQMVVSRGGRAP